MIYRHPNGNIQNFMEYLNKITDKIHRESKYCIMMGDFNLDLLKFESHQDTDNFLNTLNLFCFQPFILKPTRITDHSSTLIDNIFFNSLDHSTLSGNIVYDLTDHLPNFLIITKISGNKKNTNIFKRDFSHFDEQLLNVEVQSFDWEGMISSNSDPNQMFDLFYTKLSGIIDAHIPIKKLSKRELKIKYKPWITRAIRVSIQEKNRLYKKYLKTKSAYYHAKFKLYRNKINHLLKLSKRQYYNDYFNVNISDSRRIWKGIRRLVILKPQTLSKPTKLILNNSEICDSKSIANTFNSYFANIGNNLTCNIPKVNKCPSDYLITPLANSFYLFPTTSIEIEQEISRLNIKKSTGPYSIPTIVLKSLKSVLSKPLEIIFNSTFTTGIVPNSLKMANVVPVFKNGLQTNLTNYRPISLLSNFNKLLETIMHKRLLAFIEKENIIDNIQFGFRARHSTDHAILNIIDKIQHAIDSRDISCGIFLDFSKAFDTVNHEILIQKLDYYGIRGIANDWFVSYLSNRCQFVSLGDVTSDLQTVGCGVPQGSVLGPLLFLLYVNDFKHCSEVLDFHLFADDANLFYKHKSLTALEITLNNELVNVHNWLCANKLSLNVEKSSFVVFHPPQRKLPANFELFIFNHKLRREYFIKYLGILIDSNLTWRNQINNIVKKVKRNVGILSKLRYYVGLHILIKLYYALIYPFLIYGIISWGNTYNTTLQPLFILQKKAIRIMTFSNFDEHSSPLFKQLKIVKLYDLVTLHNVVFMYKFHNNLLPNAFDTFFTRVSETHNYNTRLSSKISYSLPKVRTNYGIFNIRFQGPKLWNSISEDIKILSIWKFKAEIKCDYIKDY